MALDLSRSIWKIKFSPHILKNYNQGSEIYSSLHKQTKGLINQVIEGKIKAGVCADFDNTLVLTNEEERIFHTLSEDPSGTKPPFCGLAMITNMPIGVISGNTVEYVLARCAEPIQDFILAASSRGKMANVAIYALSGGYAIVFDKTGAEDQGFIEKYRQNKAMPQQISKIISKIMMEEVAKIIPKAVGGGYEPVEVRAGKTVIYTYAPMFQNRVGVQKCVVGVYSGLREDLFLKIKNKARKAGIFNKISIKLGGVHSIDCQMKTLDKRVAAQEFMKRYRLHCLLYFGDAVYVRPDGTEGNDYAMIHNDNTYVFALSKKKSDTFFDKENRVQWIGKNPESMRDFLTWFLLKRIDNIISKNPIKIGGIKKVLSYMKWI